MTMATNHNGRYSDEEVAAYEAGKDFDYPEHEEGIECIECIEDYCWDNGYDSEHFICGWYGRADGPEPNKYDAAYYDPDWDK